jgi:hypothetical protein
MGPILGIKRKLVVGLFAGRCREQRDTPRCRIVLLAPEPALISLHPFKGLPERLGEVGFVQKNQTV